MQHPHLTELQKFLDELSQAAKAKRARGAQPAPQQKIRIKASDGSLHDLPAESLEAAKRRDPQLQVVRHSDASQKTVGDFAGEPTHILRNGRIERIPSHRFNARTKKIERIN